MLALLTNTVGTEQRNFKIRINTSNHIWVVFLLHPVLTVIYILQKLLSS